MSETEANDDELLAEGYIEMADEDRRFIAAISHRLTADERSGRVFHLLQTLEVTFGGITLKCSEDDVEALVRIFRMSNVTKYSVQPALQVPAPVVAADDCTLRA